LGHLAYLHGRVLKVFGSLNLILGLLLGRNLDFPLDLGEAASAACIVLFLLLIIALKPICLCLDYHLGSIS